MSGEGLGDHAERFLTAARAHRECRGGRVVSADDSSAVMELAINVEMPLHMPGLALNALVVAICIFLLSPYGSWIGQTTRTGIYAVLTIAALHAVYFSFFVTRKSVEEAFEQYARQLVLSCESVMERGAGCVPSSGTGL